MTPERWEQIKILFHAALEQAPGQRELFLTQECADDPNLRNEVESLLAEHGEAESFMETLASDVAMALIAEGQCNLVGEMVSHYKIVEVLATGGMGEVYLADDTRLGRKAALKLLPPQFTGSADRVCRFELEARAASALNHPNIVTIHEIGQTESLHYIATEFVDGVTLREHMTKTRMTLGEVLDIATQISFALEAAHEAGIVHRDVKPENVMLRRDGLVKVLDFGLAKLEPQHVPDVDDQTGIKTRVVKTNPGVLMGTVGYMSPEQARGQEVDARTDIWSLGVVLYELVAGRAPFTGETPSHVIVSILESEPAPLSIESEVPAALERIISKALCKERAERYQMAGELAQDLKTIKDELTVESRLKHFRYVSAGERTPSGKFPRKTGQTKSTASLAIAQLSWTAEYVVNGIKRHKGSTAFASVTVVLLIAALAYFTKFTSSNSEAINSVAVLPFINEGGNAEAEYLAVGISDSIINSLSRVPNLKVIGFNAALRYKGEQVDAQTVGRDLNVNAVLIGRMTQRGESLAISVELVDTRDNRRLWGEQYNRNVSDVIATHRDVVNDIVKNFRLKLDSSEQQRLTKQYTLSTEAYKAYLHGRYFLEKRTPQTTQKSIEYLEQAIKLDPNFALAYAPLANAYISLIIQNGELPGDVLPKAKNAVTKALSIDDTLAEVHAAQGNISLIEWDWLGAEQAFKRARELNPNYERNHLDYHVYLRLMKRFDEAIAESKSILELHPLSVVHNRNLALELYTARRYDEAIEQSLKTLELDPNMLSTYSWLIKSYEKKGMYDQAFEATLKSDIASLTPEEVAALREAYAATGWKGFRRKRLDMARAKLGDRFDLYFLAEELARIGDKDQAIAYLEKAYAQRPTRMTLFLSPNPIWDDFRSDPRYANIVKRMGLQP